MWTTARDSAACCCCAWPMCGGPSMCKGVACVATHQAPRLDAVWVFRVPCVTDTDTPCLVTSSCLQGTCTCLLTCWAARVLCVVHALRCTQCAPLRASINSQRPLCHVRPVIYERSVPCVGRGGLRQLYGVPALMHACWHRMAGWLAMKCHGEAAVLCASQHVHCTALHAQRFLMCRSVPGVLHASACTVHTPQASLPPVLQGYRTLMVLHTEQYSLGLLCCQPGWLCAGWACCATAIKLPATLLTRESFE